MKEKHHIKIQLTNWNLILFIFMLNSVIYLHGLVSNSYLILQSLLCINDIFQIIIYLQKNLILAYQTHKFKITDPPKFIINITVLFFPTYFLPDFQETEYLFLKDRILSKIQLVFALFSYLYYINFIVNMLNWFFIWRHNNLFNQCLNVAYKNLLGK